MAGVIIPGAGVTPKANQVRYASYDAVGNPNGAPMASLAALAGHANVQADAEAERQRQVRQAQDEHDASMRAIELENARTGETQNGGGSSGGSSRGGGGASSSSDSEMRQIELDTAREKLHQLRTPTPIDTGSIAALRSAAMPAAVPPPSYAVDKSIGDNAFARAKDKAGLLALQRSAGTRTAAMQHGTTGGGREIAGLDGILGDAADNLTGVATAQAENEARRGYEVENRNYAGALQQRGQEIGLMPSLLSLINAQRRY